VKRAALIALDQMEGGGLGSDVVAKELTSTNPVLKETASWIVSRHPEWGDALAGYLRDRLAASGLAPAEREELVRQLARFARSSAVQGLLAERLRDPAAPRDTRTDVLRAMAQARLKEAPETWVTALTQVLADADAELVREAVTAARALAVPKPKASPLTAALLQIARNPASPAPLRLGALAAVPGGLATVEPSLFDFLRGQLDKDQPVAA